MSVGGSTPEGVVQLVLKGLLEDPGWFTRLHPAWRVLLAADMATDVDRALMHPAAVRIHVIRAIISE